MTRFKIKNTYFCKHFHTKSYKTKDFTKADEVLSTNVRQKFLDYFIKENDHKYVRSSPVMPYCDPTVAFVNAGMNQFKSIFLGQQEPLYNKVANTQKCIRVGGKHNDLNLVGTDTYHHTFFEMLGNWSFGDYFKKNACELAWNLLTGPYGLNPTSMYVTYFGGDTKLNLKPDLECKEIWRSIGVADNHILPFGIENFWEMGPTGPCGPCTEIHIDHTGNANRQNDVNKNLSDLTELWNIVFIQYNRNIDGTIHLLPKYHIDTGMGLERLTAVLQGKNSNYDTDIFSNLFDCIQKNCPNLPKYNRKYNVDDKNGLDTAYRILADHSRMITACLADGMIPEQNQKLRRILRKAMLLSETVFKKETGLLNELAKVVAQNLGDVFPEMERKLDQVQQIILYEEDVYKTIRSTATKAWNKILKKEPKLSNLNILEMPGLVTAYNEFVSLNLKTFSPEFAFKMYDTHGLDETSLKLLSDALNLNFNPNDLKQQLDLAKNRTKSQYISSDNFQKLLQELLDNKIEKTDDFYKYNYYKDGKNYKFDKIDGKILGIIQNNKILNELESDLDCVLILNRTNLYSEAGGQVSDKGVINFQNNTFEISNSYNFSGYIFHNGKLNSKNKIRIGDTGIITIDAEIRLKNMLNHTTTHLLNTALKQITGGITCQKSSKVTPNFLTFDVGIYNKKLTVEDFENMEKLMKNVIENKVNVNIREINSQELLNLDNITLIPGEIYPDIGIRLIEIKTDDFLSREPCCGTHVLNTSDIKDICIINVKSLGRSTSSLTVISGDRAILARKHGEKLLKEVLELQAHDKTKNVTDKAISEFRKKLNFDIEADNVLPVTIKLKCTKILNDLSKQIKDVERDYLKQFVDLEMASVLETIKNNSENNKPYIVHFLGCSSILDNVPLQRATKICSDLPVLVISYSDEILNARCVVPENLTNTSFNAELWLNVVIKICRSIPSVPKNQNSKLVCNMKTKKINKLEWEILSDEILKSARKFAEENL